MRKFTALCRIPEWGYETDSALNLLNQVRARARLTPLTWSTTDIMCLYNTNSQSAASGCYCVESIWPEKGNMAWTAVELATEGLRRNYLLRTGRFINRMDYAKAYAGVIDVQPYQLLFPVPVQEDKCFKWINSLKTRVIKWLFHF